MSLYLRLLWTLLRCWRGQRMDQCDTLERRMRVLPNDIDVNMHMNNGRYLTVTDLLLIEFFARTGFLRLIPRQKWRPIAGGTIISFRRELKVLQPYTIRFWWTGSDKYWNYMRFDFLDLKGRICASGYTKGAFADRKGLVENDRAYEALGYEKPDIELPDAVKRWQETQALINKDAKI
ncbi:MAG: thioesterase family protein [Pseudomonadota bacterium]